MSRLVILTFAGMLVLFASHFGGYVEGRLLPVTRDTVVTRVEPAGAGWSLVWGETVKQRNCTFLRIEWHIGSPSHHAMIDVIALEPAEVRGGTEVEFGPWKLPALPRQIANRSFATVVHRCHPFWTTRTHFYPETEITRPLVP